MNVIDRYQERRVRSYVKQRKTTQSYFPRLRTRQRRRQLVLGLVVLFALMAAAGVVAGFDPTIGVLAFGVGCLVFLPIWTTLQIVSEQRGDSPTGALDEWELAERNKARSLALSLTQSLTLVPAFYLYLGSQWFDEPGRALAASGAILVLTCLFVGGCSPTMILGWTRPDPDPEDTV
ncbi:hypothetical protein ACNHUS_04160 [Actinomycetes bacterium M1A6_2h]